MTRILPQGLRPSDIARICTVPRTPAEWVFALTFPTSPLKQVLDVLIADRIADLAVLIKFSEILAAMNVRAEYARLEELLKDSKSRDAYMEMKRQEEAGRPPKAENIPSDLEKSLKTIDKYIDSLLAQAVEVKQEYREIEQQLDASSRRWDNRQQVVATQFMDQLLQQMPAIADDQARQERIMSAIRTPAPMRILDINPALVEVLNEPKAHIQQLGVAMENRVNFVRELNVLSNVLLEKEFDPKEFLQKLKAKPKLITVPKCDATDTSMICDAISGVCKRNDLQAKMAMIDKDLDVAKNSREVLQKALKAPASRPKAE